MHQKSQKTFMRCEVPKNFYNQQKIQSFFTGKKLDALGENFRLHNWTET
jgi:hypothetical protein